MSRLLAHIALVSATASYALVQFAAISIPLGIPRIFESREEEQQHQRGAMLHCADVCLRDAGNIMVSRRIRVEACFDSIYLRFLVLARDAIDPEPDEHPSERVIVAGATAAGLDDESLEEVFELYRAVTANRYRPGTYPVNMLHVLALGRHIARLVKE